jgi:hypothetical protein
MWVELLKVIIYLCAEHAEKVADKTIIPMTDDVLICQVPTCFKLATWKYFTELRESAASSTTKSLAPVAQDIDETPGRTASDVSQEPDLSLLPEQKRKEVQEIG